MTRKFCKDKLICCPIVIPIHEPVPCSKPHEECKVICNTICGNFLFRDTITCLEAWEERIHQVITVTLTVFNSVNSLSSVEVMIEQNTGEEILFTVPIGNSISKTLKNVRAITICRMEQGNAEGKFCLDICFTVNCGKR
ncbi:S-Ena type endospore appendage [Bacillus mycoides]|uniref:S-Ena type endospore appendage n=1 Tax=Bacillus mycoides TaxID=1405 RepID=UPI003D039C44